LTATEPICCSLRQILTLKSLGLGGDLVNQQQALVFVRTSVPEDSAAVIV